MVGAPNCIPPTGSDEALSFFALGLFTTEFSRGCSGSLKPSGFITLIGAKMSLGAYADIALQRRPCLIVDLVHDPLQRRAVSEIGDS